MSGSKHSVQASLSSATYIVYPLLGDGVTGAFCDPQCEQKLILAPAKLNAQISRNTLRPLTLIHKMLLH